MGYTAPTLRHRYIAAIFGLAVAMVPLHLQAASELEQHLRYQYTDKTLVLRNFYQGERLKYDSGGSPVSASAVSGDWTLDGVVRVTALKMSGARLIIEAERLSVAVDRQGFQLQHDIGKSKDKKSDRVRIEVEFDSKDISAAKADAVLSRVFLTAQDRFADLVPDYWKPCVLAASTGKNGKQYTACRFPPEFAAIPGVVASSEESPEASAASDVEVKTSDSPVARIGKGVTPPKVVSRNEPPFSDEARRAKYQGTAVVSLIVDKTGQARNIRVVNPLGFGLDRKAVETISTWRFDPSKKDGEPVDVEIFVEVSFHLY